MLGRVWRFFQRRKYVKQDVIVNSSVLFNPNTILDGNNKVGAGTNIKNSKIGRYTFIGRKNALNNVEIGKFCSIGSNVQVITATHPSKNFVSTHPVFFSTSCQAAKTFVKNDIFEEHLSVDGRNLIVGNDVWIGHNVTFLGGLRIGDGAIIGANALVTKDVPPYAIVGGVPAKIIRYRFTEDQIKLLRDYKWWDKNDTWLEQHAEQFVSVESFIHLIQSE